MSSLLHEIAYLSPLGPIACEVCGETCHRLHLGKPAAMAEQGPDHPVLAWLDAYFSGVFSPLPPITLPHTPFQGRLRAALLAIPPGEVMTYGELARRLNSAPRAVGQALGANPLPILIPATGS